MELTEFITKFAEQFIETPVGEFKAETEYKTLDEWNSLMMTVIISMIDAEYDITIQGADIRKSETIEDLFKIVRAYSAGNPWEN
jgi:acyl carrier protein